MIKTAVILFISGSALFGLAGSSAADWEWDCSTVSAASVPVSVVTFPDGNGMRLDDCYIFGGARIDATITLQLLDLSGDPVAGYPASEMWLESTSGAMVLCPGGSIADHDTDQNGETTFSGPIQGGGSFDPDNGDRMQVVGVWNCIYPLELEVYSNSPDMNGDLVVDLSDVVIFAEYFYGTYDYAADFHWDGLINLSDLVWLVQGMGAA